MTDSANPDVHHRPAMNVAEDWREYIRAAERKIAIAKYHSARLAEQSAQVSEPSIAEQAHFEGVIIAFVSATEQVAGAIHVAHGRRGNAPPLHILLPQIAASETQTRLEEWANNPVVRDVRDVRNAAAHRYYKKVGIGDATQVQELTEGNGYGGPRKLVPYCLAAVNHLECLMQLIADLEEELTGRRSPPNAGLNSASTG